MRNIDVMFFFFKQKSAYEIYQCDWSSDVCSSDLDASADANAARQAAWTLVANALLNLDETINKE